MGNPSSGCAPVQSPMPPPKGSSRHRQSLSISSLPLDKLERINCEKRTSVSAVSSPAKVALTDPEKLSIAIFLGHGHAKHQEFTRKKVPSVAEEHYLKGIELATDDRKTKSFNPFQGQRRVGSGSFTTPCKSASEYSPRARSRSTTSSPRKLDKYAVAKIAASLFHSPTKLERSMSLTGVAHRSTPEVVKKGNPCPLAVGEVILPANLEVPPFWHQNSQFTQGVNVEDGGNRNSSSNSDLAMDMEESASPQTSNASSVQHNIIITEMLECEGETEHPATIAFEEPPQTTEDVTSGSPSFHSQTSLNGVETNMHIIEGGDSSREDVSSPSSSQSSCTASTETSIQLLSTGSPSLLETQELDHDYHESIAAVFEDAVVKEESNGTAVDDNLQLLLLATEEATEDTKLIDTGVRCSLSSVEDDPTGVVSTDSDDESLPVPSEDESLPVPSEDESLPVPSEDESLPVPSEDESLPVPSEDESLSIPSTGSSKERDVNIQVSEMKATIRKRRRSKSASGIGAMLLKMVRVSDSAQMVTRRIPKVGSPELVLSGVEALRARKYVLEKTALISMGSAREDSALISSAHSTPAHVCQIEADDAVKATYSKFVDIEIDPGGHCIELVQHSKDEQDGAVASPFESRQRSQQATPGTSPKHLNDQKCSTCTVHQGILNDKFDTQTKSSPLVSSASSNAQTTDNRCGGRASKETTGRARIDTSDLDSLKECLKTVKTTNSDNGGHHLSISSSNQAPTNTRERPRTVVSRLQAPTSGAFSRVDVIYRPSSTVSILANPTFSSSHQDKLWEEQAEIYSSGGRGTPGRDDEATTTNIIINCRTSPSPAFATDSLEPNPSQRRSGAVESSGNKRGRPNTPLRSLFEDHHSRGLPESGHFIQQIMSRIRGSSSPKALPFPKSSSQLAMDKRRNTWTRCICFSVK